jgi:hypothetical protein
MCLSATLAPILNHEGRNEQWDHLWTGGLGVLVLMLSLVMHTGLNPLNWAESASEVPMTLPYEAQVLPTSASTNRCTAWGPPWCRKRLGSVTSSSISRSAPRSSRATSTRA